MWTNVRCWKLLVGLALLHASAWGQEHVLLTEYHPNTRTVGDSSAFVEIYNPRASAIELSDYYISNDRGSYYLLPGATGAGPAPVMQRGEWIVRFPPGTSLPGQGTVIVAMSGDGFRGFGQNSDFEILRDGAEGGNPSDPDMIRVLSSSITPQLVLCPRNI